MTRDTKLEIRVGEEEKARLQGATRRLGVRASTWARAVILRELEDLEAKAAALEEGPTDADLEAARSARGALRGTADARHLTATLRSVRKGWKWRR